MIRDEEGFRVGGFLPVPPGRAPEVATRGLPTNRVGYVGNFFQWTWGPKIQLTEKPNVFLRPNFRWDYFDGVATNDGGGLGGNAVIVTGKDGFVYNAHLEAYGTLGAVHTGEVVGYVGNSGDAAGGATHDHFEWHPYHPEINWVSPYGYRVVASGSPPAVDPYPYLRAACS